MTGQLTQIGPEWKENNRGIYQRWVPIDDPLRGTLRLRGEIYWAGTHRWVVTVHLETVETSPGGQVSIKGEAQLSRLPTVQTLLEAYYAANEELVRQETAFRLKGGYGPS